MLAMSSGLGGLRSSLGPGDETEDGFEASEYQPSQEAGLLPGIASRASSSERMCFRKLLKPASRLYLLKPKPETPTSMAEPSRAWGMFTGAGCVWIFRCASKRHASVH